MPHAINVDVRGSVDVDGDTPPLWVLRDVLGMTGTKFGSGMALWRVHGASGWKPNSVVREAGGQHPVIRHHRHEALSRTPPDGRFRRPGSISRSNTMNGCHSSTESYSELQYNLQRVSDFHTVLLGMAAHDLRQPLQVIQSTYEWLSGRFDDDVERMRLQRGERAVARLAEQLDRLAAALRLYEHTTTMKLSPVPLAPIFDGVRTENLEPARQKGLELRVRPTRAVVVSNAVLLDGIVRNLVRNAIKYTDSGHVLLSCGRHGNDIRIDIYDTGIGMSADELPRIFEAFQRLDSSRSDGLGLGLFIVRRGVELLGHRIEVSSTVGRGSRFSVLAKTQL
jgi:two-component system phosphate regulon sensor histidine kinase PhoR